MSQRFQVDISILKKYDRPGPRYTSYPTAPHFHDGFTARDLIQEIQRVNKEDPTKPLSLYFHIPFCAKLCYYCACNTYITHDQDRISSYLRALFREIEMFSGILNSERKVVQMHWGGGTPTYLSTDQIIQLVQKIKKHFTFDDNAEISIEVDPRQARENLIETLADLGFNRISFGIQDVNPTVQEAVNRVQSLELNKSVIERARKAGFQSVNVDLIYGLPHQTVESFKKTIDTVIRELNPDRLAVFNFAHVPWLKKHQNLIRSEWLPKADEKLEILKLTIEELTSRGYEFIGMDHFARPDDELTLALKNGTLYRNFQGYNTHAEAEVIALGATSISQLQNAYSQNVKSDKEYIEKIDANEFPVERGIRLSQDDLIRRKVITELMCNNVVHKSKIETDFNIHFDDYFQDSMAKLTEFLDDGLVSLYDDKIVVEQPGRLVVRNIAMAFDAYIDEDLRKQKQMYSRTV